RRDAGDPRRGLVGGRVLDAPRVREGPRRRARRRREHLGVPRLALGGGRGARAPHLVLQSLVAASPRGLPRPRRDVRDADRLHGAVRRAVVRSPRPVSDDPDRRPPGWPALAVYAVAFVLVLVLGLAFVALVAWLRSPGPVAHVVDGANAFALSRAGLMTGALVNAVVLGAVALVAAGRPRAERLRLGPSRATGIGIAAATTGVVGVSFFCSAVSELARVRGGGVLEAIAHGLES